MALVAVPKGQRPQRLHYHQPTMKKKSKITHDEMLADGTIKYGIRSDGVVIENGRPVVTAKDPITPKPTADVVAPIVPKTNVAPRITDAPRKMPPGVTGLQRAINANVAAQGGTPNTSQTKS